MKKVIVTGATSFLGKNVIQRLIREKYDVIAYARRHCPEFEEWKQLKNFRMIYGSLNNMELMKEQIYHADYFIHFAWDGSGNIGRADHDIQFNNIEYSMQALKIAYALGCKYFIFPGSQAEYGKTDNEIFEDMECHPVSEYGKAKLEFATKAKEFCKNRDIEFIHLRIFSVYGFGDKEGTLVDTCIKGFNSGNRFTMGPCLQKWNYLYIDDFSLIIARMMNSNCKSGIYNIASNDTRVLREFVNVIYENSLKKIPCIYGETTHNPEGSPSIIPNVNKMEAVTGLKELTPFHIGIYETMQKMGYEVQIRI